MEDIAEGKPDGVIISSALRAGLQAYFPVEISFSMSGTSIREYALEMIGRTALPEAIEYLSAMTPERIGWTIARVFMESPKLALRAVS